ncbi:hypothetical protein RFI_09741 [Reticulomyxa filosa]|uniref:Kelch motif family protein n=1 Tax=Reticulomyxa filosa TaxID=46433 RepID=X6NNA1_RETFI|nr:hypothetical protein RFI_09741 [Reticulomyxa filosa]|eukprot:ETO27393.1 hypothetical protein RFI_09741 [Reticulomyxa filosa]
MACYSYHILKNEYKFICEYPSHVTLSGHCVVKLKKNNNDKITLLSFGGYKDTRHTLVMKYISVWNNNEINKTKNYNQWIPFTDNHNNPIIIGRDKDNYCGARAIIGGSNNNNLLFITYFPRNISIFDLNTFQFINHDYFQINNVISFHCFVSKSENDEEMMKRNKKKYEMILFCENAGLSIEYDEDNNTFQFYKLLVCYNIAPFNEYAYIRVNDIILFFGGWNTGKPISKSVYKYVIQENKWTIFQNILPNPLKSCVAILSEDNIHIHMIGGRNDENIIVQTHTKTKVRVWDISHLSKNEIKFWNQYWIRILKIRLGWIDDFDQIIFKYSKKK